MYFTWFINMLLQCLLELKRGHLSLAASFPVNFDLPADWQPPASASPRLFVPLTLGLFWLNLLSLTEAAQCCAAALRRATRGRYRARERLTATTAKPLGAGPDAIRWCHGVLLCDVRVRVKFEQLSNPLTYFVNSLVEAIIRSFHCVTS